MLQGVQSGCRCCLNSDSAWCLHVRVKQWPSVADKGEALQLILPPTEEPVRQRRQVDILIVVKPICSKSRDGFVSKAAKYTLKLSSQGCQRLVPNLEEISPTLPRLSFSPLLPQHQRPPILPRSPCPLNIHPLLPPSRHHQSSTPTASRLKWHPKATHETLHQE